MAGQTEVSTRTRKINAEFRNQEKGIGVFRLSEELLATINFTPTRRYVSPAASSFSARCRTYERGQAQRGLALDQCFQSEMN